MHSILKRGLFLLTFIGAVSLPGIKAEAKEAPFIFKHEPVAEIETVVNSCSLKDVKLNIEDYLEPLSKGEYLDMAFAQVEDFLYIRSEASEESEYVGKMYSQNAANIIEVKDGWAQIQSGDVTGFAKEDELLMGVEAVVKAEELVEAAEAEGLEDPFTYAESREHEEARLKAEAEAAAYARKLEAGQSVVNYAKQFVGNPYVYGGTSLTRGTDCSGFVQSVYRHFGYSLPRTSGAQRGVGTAVSYKDAIPGDIVCYSGHVAIYVGNGQVVHALNPSKGILVTSATYAPILTVRRVVS